jgi:hypothetical protein
MEGQGQSRFSGLPIRVTAENFCRAESHRHFASVVITEGAFGEFSHHRRPTPIESFVLRSNRDTLYSGGVFDLDAGAVTITLPDPGSRFMSMTVIDEDHYVSDVVYGAGRYVIDRERVGTRYVMVGVRIFTDPSNPDDMGQVHAMQDAMVVEQKNRGAFVTPNWERESHRNVREALLALGRTLQNSKRMFGSRQQVDPLRHLIGTATMWGGSPDRAITYVRVRPSWNDGSSTYKVTVKDVPVDAFWSISVYNAKGCFQKNPYDAYTVNSITAQRSSDGSISVKFGDYDRSTPNCLPIMSGWSYMVRMYRPRAEVLKGEWTFPQAQPSRVPLVFRSLKTA